MTDANTHTPTELVHHQALMICHEPHERLDPCCNPKFKVLPLGGDRCWVAIAAYYRQKAGWAEEKENRCSTTAWGEYAAGGQRIHTARAHARARARAHAHAWHAMSPTPLQNRYFTCVGGRGGQEGVRRTAYRSDGIRSRPGQTPRAVRSRPSS